MRLAMQPFLDRRDSAMPPFREMADSVYTYDLNSLDDMLTYVTHMTKLGLASGTMSFRS